MKKLAIVLCAILVFALTGCGTASPTSVTETFLEGIKAQDSEAISTTYAKGDDFALSSKELSGFLEDEDSDEDILADFTDEFTTKLLDFDYEISNEIIDGDKATVDVKITTYEFGKEFTTFFNNYISQAFVLAWDDDADAKLEKLSNTLMQTMIGNLEEKTYSGTATLTLSKTDDGWVVDEIDDNSDFMNVITGGTIESMEDLESIWSE